MPERTEVLRWFADNPQAGTLDGVRHFWDCPDATSKSHRKEYQKIYIWRRHAKKGKRPAKPAKPARGTQEAQPLPAATGTPSGELEQEIAHAEQARARMAADHSWSAWERTSRYLRQLREQLQEMRTQRAEDFDPSDDEQVIAAVIALPPRYLSDDRILQAVLQARK